MLVLKQQLLAICVLFTSAVLTGQVKHVGTPFILNYSRSAYQAGSQTWDIEQGKNGMMYFANNNGLLEFDGNQWQVYPMPNNSIIRSIEAGEENLIYAGGFDEFGYYLTGEMGQTEYNSLTHLLDENQRNFGDVWKIHRHPDGVIFQSYSQLIIFKKDIRVIPAPSSFHFSFLVNNELYVNDLEMGLMRYAMGNLYPLVGLEQLKGKEIWGILALDEGLLIATASEGVFFYDGNSLSLWETPSLNFLKENQIYSTRRLGEELLFFGTIQNGFLVCDEQGRPIKHINMEDGLQNNTILCMNQDGFGNLWLGTDMGIDYVEINSPLSQLSYNYGFSTGYAAILFQDRLYLGTNQGLFVMRIGDFRDGIAEKGQPELIEETRGQVWALTEIDGQLFCGHNNGTFLVNGNRAKKISSIPGGWSYVQVPGQAGKIIGGNYSGLALYEKTNGRWTFSRPLKGFNESSRTMAFDDKGALWIAHGYKGVFRLVPDPDFDSILHVDLFNARNSNLSSSDVNLAKIDGSVVFTDLQSTYTFSDEDNRFVLYEPLNSHLVEVGNIRTIRQDKSGNIWYFTDRRSGVLRLLEDGNYSDVHLPFQQIRDKFVKGFEFVYPLDEGNVFFGAEKGFVHYNPSITKDYDYQFRTYLRSMHSFAPDSVFTTMQHGDRKIILDYSNNDLEFNFSANDFENPQEMVFSTFLEGYDQGWSEWQKKRSRDITNLDEGSYSFFVRARNVYGTVTPEVSLKFRVRPPFQRSLWAYFLYGLLAVILLVLFARVLKKRYDLQRRRSEQDQLDAFRRKEEELQREALEAEKEIIRMRNEQLREEMKRLDKELANSTMQTLQKNRMLITLRDELKKLTALSAQGARVHEVNHLVRKINREIDDENQWKLFETHFESVHEEFLKRIKTAYPELTPRELKLCAYLRMNISSKEIALLMNISTRGVEISRYRLRKKLNLPRETNLTDFILSF